MANQHPTPPPELLKEFSEQAREDSKKRGHPGYCKTFARLCIEWAFQEVELNSQSTPNDRQIRSSNITPLPELVVEWRKEWIGKVPNGLNELDFLAQRGAQYGADQELEACCEWLDREGWSGESRQLRAARRPKPPSLKEQALKTLEDAPGPDYPKVMTVLDADQHALIRRALEQLDG